MPSRRFGILSAGPGGYMLQQGTQVVEIAVTVRATVSDGTVGLYVLIVTTVRHPVVEVIHVSPACARSGFQVKDHGSEFREKAVTTQALNFPGQVASFVLCESVGVGEVGVATATEVMFIVHVLN